MAIIEPGPFGGTCLNRGCIPSKMLIRSADLMDSIRRSSFLGIDVCDARANWDFIVSRVAERINGEAKEDEESYRRYPNVAIFKDDCRFLDHKLLEVAGERIGANTIVIAAGSRPHIPQIDGLDKVPYITSDEALSLPQQPGRLLVLGGGFVAAELAHFFGALGTQVTIMQRGPRLLRGEDKDVGERFTEVYRRKFEVMLNSQARRVYRESKDIAVDVVSGGQRQTVRGDCLLLALGRVPNADALDLEKTGVEVDERGFIKADEYLETTAPGIWALGDIVGRYMLKHKANLEARHVAHNIEDPQQKLPVDYHAIPHAVFASPQVASVGITERQAQERGVPYTATRYDFYRTAYGSSIEDRDGFVKVLAHRETREILGCHILGTEASVLIQEVANAMRLQLTVDAILESVYVHPALPEVVQRAFQSLSF